MANALQRNGRKSCIYLVRGMTSFAYLQNIKELNTRIRIFFCGDNFSFSVYFLLVMREYYVHILSTNFLHVPVFKAIIPPSPCF